MGRTAQLLSIDTSGDLFVWDMQALAQTQALKVSLPTNVSVSALALLPPHRQVSCSRRRFHLRPV